MTIKVMPPELAAQIAAGEVVERPVSVVKELVENALDAGASRIAVEVQGGGIDELRITDNGAGIPAGDVSLAFQRHATSKLTSPDMLESIATLGFRGEALPSVSAVSRLTLSTRPESAIQGHYAEFVWAQLQREGARGCPPGTSVVVADLFGNQPARRKFLKSPRAEAGRIHDLISRYALAYPETSFRLTIEDRQALATSGSGKALDALLAVYGVEVAEGMLEVSGTDPDTGYGVAGFVSAPSLSRANRTYITLFVNRRWIQNRMLNFALEEAYHGLLPQRRFPISLLNIALPYGEVDVNFHPSKREVRFRQDSKVYSALQRAVRSALTASAPVPNVGTASRQSAQGLSSEAFPRATLAPGFFRSPFDSGDNSPSVGIAQSGDDLGEATLAPADPFVGALTPRQVLPTLRVVGQVRLTYIVAESPNGMYLIDQHAAHERVLFDQIIRCSAQRQSQAQPLLAPMAVELTPGQRTTLISHWDFLRSYGYDLEHFGEDSYLLRAVPTILTTQDPGKSLLDVLDLAAVEGQLQHREEILAASLACHSAVRAGQSMTEGEMRALLEQLEAADNPHTCPHGRPTVIHFSSYYMEREFRRR